MTFAINKYRQGLFKNLDWVNLFTFFEQKI